MKKKNHTEPEEDINSVSGSLSTKSASSGSSNLSEEIRDRSWDCQDKVIAVEYVKEFIKIENELLDEYYKNPTPNNFQKLLNKRRKLAGDKLTK